MLLPPLFSLDLPLLPRFLFLFFFSCSLPFFLLLYFFLLSYPGFFLLRLFDANLPVKTLDTLHHFDSFLCYFRFLPPEFSLVLRTLIANPLRELGVLLPPC